MKNTTSVTSVDMAVVAESESNDLTEANLERVINEIEKMSRDQGEVIAIKPTWIWHPKEPNHEG